MRWKQLRQIDLNLLVAFAVFAEERSISAAAKRLFLSQGAASRTLQRLRLIFDDDLMIRGGRGYELTPAGTRLAAELERLLPELEALLGRPAFHAPTESVTFRLAGPDNVCSAICPRLCRQILPSSPNVSFQFLPWGNAAMAMLDHGRIDLILATNEILIPLHLHSQQLYTETWSLVFWKNRKAPPPSTLKEYLAAEHITVSTQEAVQSIPDKRLAGLGQTRRSPLIVPYFGTALASLPGTELVLTATESAARLARRDPDLRVASAPPEMTPFAFQAVWHPRLDHDPAQRWLRQTMLEIAGQIDAE